MTKLYVLKTPQGDLVAYTLANTKRKVWGNSFDFVSSREYGFTVKYWPYSDAALAAAKRKGYAIVQVTLQEVV